MLGMLILLVLGAVVLYAKFGEAPFQGEDDSAFLGRPLNLPNALAAHNEHPVVLFFPLWKILHQVGGGPEMIMIAIFILHLASGVAIYRLIGLAGLGVWMLLGTGAQNLGWPFQLGWVMSVTMGLWGLAVQSSRLRALLLVGAVLSSTIGLFFLAAAAVLRPSRWLTLPAIAYGIWLAVAYATIEPQADVLRSMAQWPGYIALAPGVAAGAFFGVGSSVGLLLFLGYLVWVVARLPKLEPIALAGLCGLVALYAGIAIGRTSYGLAYAAEGRYVYVAAPFLLMMLIGLPRPAAMIALAAALAANVHALATVSQWWK
jgi:hypothetical protein